MKLLTIAELIEYLRQFDNNSLVVLNAEDYRNLPRDGGDYVDLRSLTFALRQGGA